MFDKNKDGQLDFEEFCETWKYIGLRADENELKDIFYQFDQNKDGMISDSEFIDAIMEEVTFFSFVSVYAETSHDNFW